MKQLIILNKAKVEKARVNKEDWLQKYASKSNMKVDIGAPLTIRLSDKCYYQLDKLFEAVINKQSEKNLADFIRLCMNPDLDITTEYVFGWSYNDRYLEQHSK